LRSTCFLLALLVDGFMVFNATFNNISVISWQSVLFVEETRGPGENHRPVASHWQTLSHNVTYILPWSRFKLTTSVVICTDCTGSCKTKYHTITAMSAHQEQVDQVHCNYFWQYDLWWGHYWSCDRYVQAIVTPSKNKIATFITWISESMICHVQIPIMGSVQVL